MLNWNLNITHIIPVILLRYKIKVWHKIWIKYFESLISYLCSVFTRWSEQSILQEKLILKIKMMLNSRPGLQQASLANLTSDLSSPIWNAFPTFPSCQKVSPEQQVLQNTFFELKQNRTSENVANFEAEGEAWLFRNFCEAHIFLLILRIWAVRWNNTNVTPLLTPPDNSHECNEFLVKSLFVRPNHFGWSAVCWRLMVMLKFWH